MNITAQSVVPNTRANVCSSVPLGCGRAAGMRVDPDPRELLRPPARVDLLVKEVRHRLVVEFDVDRRADLFDQRDVFDQQQVAGGGQAEPADLGAAQVTQEQEFRPGRGREPQHRPFRLRRR